MADAKDKFSSGVVAITGKDIQNFVSSCGISCSICKSEIEPQTKTPIVVNVGPEKLKEYEELFTKISSIDEMKMPFHDTSKNLAQKIERGMFEVMTNNMVTEVFVVDGCINYDGEVARFDSVIVLNEEAARDLAKQHNTVYKHLDFTNEANMSDEEFDRIVAEAEKNGNSNTDVVRKWRETVRETTETLHIKEDE